MLALALAAAAAQPHLPVTFGDWIVGCDNRRDCEAVGLPPEVYEQDAVQVPGVVVRRRSEAAAEPSIEIDQRFFELEDYTSEIVADGRKTGLAFSREGDLVGDPRRFAAVLAEATSVSLVSPAGETLGTFPTRGASAALRWMDDRQERAGTVTALVARGPKPATAVPSPPTLPRIAVPPASSRPARTLDAAQLAEIRKPFECDDEPRGETGYHRLDASHSIAIVNCWNGPYQSDGIIVVIPDSGPYRLASIEPEPGAAPDQPANAYNRLISPYYDPKTRLLWTEYRGRGLNDCGALGSWAWDGTSFRLTHYAALDVCRGVTARLPYWTTANAPASADE